MKVMIKIWDYSCNVFAQEEQVRKVRAGNQEKFQQLESAIQDKLQQAADRRLQLEAEQREKLRNHVSNPYNGEPEILAAGERDPSKLQLSADLHQQLQAEQRESEPREHRHSRQALSAVKGKLQNAADLHLQLDAEQSQNLHNHVSNRHNRYPEEDPAAIEHYPGQATVGLQK